MSWRTQILLVFVFLTAIVFMPSTIILIFGMMPTIVVAFFDTAKKKTRAITIGAMNITGCTPFLIHLWGIGHDIDNAVIILTDPLWVIFRMGPGSRHQ